MRSYIEVPVGHGLITLIDVGDADLVLPFHWHAYRASTGRVWYARRNLRTPDGRWIKRFMHSLLTGWPLVDHANSDGLDNRRANLRPATRAQNDFNRGKPRGGSSRFKGVSWKRAHGKWQAGIEHGGRRVHLGTFEVEEDAAHAYDTAAHELFGEYARPNFPVAPTP